MDELPPEYVNASNAGRIVGVVGVFHFIALTFVFLRVYTRLAIVRAFGVDDALILVAAALALGSWICLVVQIPYGLGRHALTIEPEARIKFERITFWKTVISDGFAMGLLRISMAISLLRLKRDLNWYKWSLYAVMGFVVAYSIQAIVWLFVYCTPFSGWWEFQWANPFDPRCHDFNIFLKLTYWNISCNIFTDVCLGALPIPIIWHLKMKLRVRLYVIGILNLGYFAVLMGILKAVFMLTTGGDPDAIFDYWVHFWQNLQLNFGIMAVCASFLKPLVGRILKLNSTVASYGSSRHYNRSGPTPLEGGTIGSNRYAGGARRRDVSDREFLDDFELRTQDDFRGAKRGMPPIVTTVHAARSRSTSDDHQSAEADNAYGPHSDASSEEIMLQEQGATRGIVCTKDISVEFSNK